jgi:hypothetical protein
MDKKLCETANKWMKVKEINFKKYSLLNLKLNNRRRTIIPVNATKACGLDTPKNIIGLNIKRLK